YFVQEFSSSQSRSITASVPTSFLEPRNAALGRNVARAPLGWAADSRSVILTDGWDIWRVPISGAGAVNLTAGNAADSTRYGAVISGGEEGIDTRQPIFVKMYGEWNKREGIVRLDPVRGGVTRWLWDDAHIEVRKASVADAFIYSRQRGVE